MIHTTGPKPSSRLWRAVAIQTALLLALTLVTLLVVGSTSNGDGLGCLGGWLGPPC